MSRPGVLWVKSSVPWPLDQGNRFIAYNLIRHLSPELEITLVVPVKDDAERERAQALEPYARVVTVQRPSSRTLAHRAAWRATYRLRSALRYEPPEVFYENFGALRQVLADEARSGRHDVAFLHYWFLHPLIDALPGLPTVFLLHDNEPQRIESEMETHPERRPRLERKLASAVRGHRELLRRATRVLFYSQEDLDDWVRREDGRPANAEVFSYMFDFPDAAPRDEVDGRILFTGHMSYGPNVDAVVWFADEVLPRVRERRPDATFRIAGKLPAPEVKALAARHGIEVTGYVDDMRAELTACAVYVAPLRYGGGLKIKLIEAGGQLCPIVATTSALRGLGLEHGRDALRADDPDALAGVVVELLDDRERAAALGASARTTLVDRFGPETTAAHTLRILRDVVSEGAPR